MKRAYAGYSRACKDLNRLNGVWTSDAFLLIILPLNHTLICDFAHLLFKSRSNSHSFLFQIFIYVDFCQIYDFRCFIVDELIS